MLGARERTKNELQILLEKYGVSPILLDGSDVERELNSPHSKVKDEFFLFLNFLEIQELNKQIKWQEYWNQVERAIKLELQKMLFEEQILSEKIQKKTESDFHEAEMQKYERELQLLRDYLLLSKKLNESFAVLKKLLEMKEASYQRIIGLTIQLKETYIQSRDKVVEETIADIAKEISEVPDAQKRIQKQKALKSIVKNYEESTKESLRLMKILMKKYSTMPKECLAEAELMRARNDSEVFFNNLVKALLITEKTKENRLADIEKSCEPIKEKRKEEVLSYSKISSQVEDQLKEIKDLAESRKNYPNYKADQHQADVFPSIPKLSQLIEGISNSQTSSILKFDNLRKIVGKMNDILEENKMELNDSVADAMGNVFDKITEFENNKSKSAPEKTMDFLSLIDSAMVIEKNCTPLPLLQPLSKDLLNEIDNLKSGNADYHSELGPD